MSSSTPHHPEGESLDERVTRAAALAGVSPKGLRDSLRRSGLGPDALHVGPEGAMIRARLGGRDGFHPLRPWLSAHLGADFARIDTKRDGHGPASRQGVRGASAPPAYRVA
jgi:hypothetical protein